MMIVIRQSHLFIANPFTCNSQSREDILKREGAIHLCSIAPPVYGPALSGLF
jgi:hypothetical protein